MHAVLMPLPFLCKYPAPIFFFRTGLTFNLPPFPLHISFSLYNNAPLSSTKKATKSFSFFVAFTEVKGLSGNHFRSPGSTQLQQITEVTAFS